MKLLEEAIRRRLDGWPVARLATIGPDGRPQLVPIVFARVGESLWSPIDGKPKSGRELARVRNIRVHPAVGLLLDEYRADWTQLWWIRIDATARVVVGDASDSLAAAPLAALRAKYRQYESVPVVGEPPTLLEFVVERIVSWSARI
jgi:PPOX class probable F420-dependent enzyme